MQHILLRLTTAEQVSFQRKRETLYIKVCCLRHCRPLPFRREGRTPEDSSQRPAVDVNVARRYNDGG
jgi:hypothetical protein